MTFEPSVFQQLERTAEATGREVSIAFRPDSALTRGRWVAQSYLWNGDGPERGEGDTPKAALEQLRKRLRQTANNHVQQADREHVEAYHRLDLLND